MVSIDIDKLSSYKIEHLKKCLIYRGDRLHNIQSLKSAQVRVLEYFDNGTNNTIVDPTPKKVWLRKKAESIGVILSLLFQNGTLRGHWLK